MALQLTQERWKNKMKVIIVGGVAGGATAAARIRRLNEHAEITVFERSGYKLWTSILYWRRDHRHGRTYTTDTREFF